MDENKQKEAEPTKAERVADFHCVTLHLHRVKVIQDAIHDHIGPVPRAVGVTLAKNGTWAKHRRPKLAVLHPISSGASALLKFFRQRLLGLFDHIFCHLNSAYSSESHAVGVAVSVSPTVGVAFSGGSFNYFAQCYYKGIGE